MEELPENLTEELEKLDPHQLLDKLKCFTKITHEKLWNIPPLQGDIYAMRRILEALDKNDNWDYHLVKALKSRSLNKKVLARKISDYFTKSNAVDENTHLIHFQYFPYLDTFNESNKWKVLVKKLGLKDSDVSAIEEKYNANFMKLAFEQCSMGNSLSIKHLLNTLKELGERKVADEIFNEYILKRKPKPRSTPQPRSIPQLTSTPRPTTIDPVHETSGEADTDEGGKGKSSSTSTTGNKMKDDDNEYKYPIQCSAEIEDTVCLDQHDKLQKYNNQAAAVAAVSAEAPAAATAAAEAAEITIDKYGGGINHEDNYNIKATPVIFERNIFESQEMNLESEEEESNNSGHSFVNVGSPQMVMESPESDMGSPQNDMGSTPSDMGSPQNDMGSTPSDMGSPQNDMGFPQRNMGFPQRNMELPQNDLGQVNATRLPQNDLGQPNLMETPQNDLGQANLMETSQNNLGSLGSVTDTPRNDLEQQDAVETQYTAKDDASGKISDGNNVMYAMFVIGIALVAVGGIFYRGRLTR
ncbi:uncharacterized protein LOC115219089 isoform X1 [Argonauta hians]